YGSPTGSAPKPPSSRRPAPAGRPAECGPEAAASTVAQLVKHLQSRLQRAIGVRESRMRQTVPLRVAEVGPVDAGDCWFGHQQWHEVGDPFGLRLFGAGFPPDAGGDF